MKVKKKKKCRKGLFSKFLIIFIVLINLIFTYAVLDVFREVGSEPSTLIVSFFGFTTGELWMLASIKKKKVKSSPETQEEPIE